MAVSSTKRKRCWRTLPDRRTLLTSNTFVLCPQLDQTEKEKQSLEESLRKELADMKGQLDRTLAEKQSVEADLAGQLDSLTEQLERISSEKDQSEKRLNGQLDDLHKSLISEYSGGFGDMGLKLSSSVLKKKR